jgi:hypothetical protein
VDPRNDFTTGSNRWGILGDPEVKNLAL